MGFFDFLNPSKMFGGGGGGMPNPLDPAGLMSGGGGDSSGGGDASGALGGMLGGAMSAGATKDAAENKDFDPTKTGGVPQTKFNQMRQKQLGMGGNT